MRQLRHRFAGARSGRGSAPNAEPRPPVGPRPRRRGPWVTPALVVSLLAAGAACLDERMPAAEDAGGEVEPRDAGRSESLDAARRSDAEAGADGGGRPDVGDATVPDAARPAWDAADATDSGGGWQPDAGESYCAIQQVVEVAPEVKVRVDDPAPRDDWRVVVFTLAESRSLVATVPQGRGGYRRMSLSAGYCGDWGEYESVAHSCRDPAPAGERRLVHGELAPGPYFLPVWTPGSGEPEPYVLTLRFGDPLPIPPNDWCRDALEIATEGEVVVHGDLTTAHCSDRVPALYYHLSFPQWTRARFVAEGEPAHPRLMLCARRCEDTAYCYVAGASPDRPVGATVLDLPALPAGEYYLQVAVWYRLANVGPFELTALYGEPSPPPVNDTCEGAVVLPARGEQRYLGDTSTARPDSEWHAGRNVYFTFELEEPTVLGRSARQRERIEIETGLGSNWPTALELPLMRGACGALEEVVADPADHRDLPGGQHGHLLPAGRYFLAVQEPHRWAFGPFELVVVFASE